MRKIIATLNAENQKSGEIPKKFALSQLGPFIGLAFGLALTSGLWLLAENLSKNASQQMFEQQVSHATLAIDRVLGDISGLLSVIRGVVENRPDLDEADFESIMQAQNQRLFSSGLQYVALIKPLTGGRCTEQTARPPNNTNVPSLKLGPGCLQLASVYPLATNEHLIGPMEVLESPDRANAVLRAMDFGYIAFTPPIDVAPDSIASPGLISFLPAYRRTQSLATVPARREALVGLAVAAFSFEDLLRAELGGAFFRKINMRIVDLGLVGRSQKSEVDSRRVLEGQSLIRRFGPESGIDSIDPDADWNTFERQHAGRNWLVSFSQNSQVESFPAVTSPQLVLLLGGLLTALLFSYMRTLATDRFRANSIAEKMTQHLGEREAQLRQALDAAEMGSWMWRIDDGTFTADSRAIDLLGLGSGPIDGLFAQIHPDDKTTARIALQRAIETGMPFYAECRLVATVKGVRWVELSAQLTLTALGEVTLASGLVRNVTERYRLTLARRQLLSKLITAEEKERRRIARELHDQLGQEITAISLGLRNLQEMAAESEGRHELLNRLKQIVSDVDSRVERFTLDLRPVVLDDLGLEAALEAQFTQWSDVHCIRVNSHMSGLTDANFPFELSTTIFRVIQESLTNVARHAGASAVDVIIEASDTEVKVVVEDNGEGQQRPIGASSHGLAGMRERVEALGGQFRSESSAGSGFSVFVRLPVGEMAEILVES